jgi:hypothetical protein
MADLAVVAAFIGSSAAVAGAINTAVTLRRAANNLREQLRPVVVVELRKDPYAKGVPEIVVSNFGQTPARDLTVSFHPEIKDPDPDSKDATSGTAALVRRFGRTISVLAPGAQLEQIYYDIELVRGGGTFMDATPELAVASVQYFGSDGHVYEDDFELDVHLGLPSISPGAWVSRGLAPPSTSAEALAEVAQLEELWRLPAKRAITGTD